MKTTILVAATFGSAHAWDHFDQWDPPGPGDVRAPCPMLNSLANHGFLPHSGKDITENQTIDALSTALNVDSSLGHFLHAKAVSTNPQSNATTFSLSDLSNHNILEHDASLSRGDFYFGDDHTFNETVFDETRSYWSDVIDVQMAANARNGRVATSNATNPTFTLTETGEQFGYGESAAYIIALGDRDSGTVNKSFVEYLFEHERLPLELGWSRPEEIIDLHVVGDMLGRVIDAAGSSPEDAVSIRKRAGMHGGVA
ncbi:Chloroperoxidase [Xylariales sp. AK1849]|nr:Chloroperoxidase [Xylariales sp. AK1849]